MALDNDLVAAKLRRWEKYLNSFRLPEWEDIPDFGLYMEQVITLLKQYLDYLPPELKEEQFITAATINNYVRTKIMPEPRKKRYYRIQIAYLIMILTLKQGLSMALIHKLLPRDLSEEALRTVYGDYVRHHRMAAQFFVDQVRLGAGAILHHEVTAEPVAKKGEDLIVASAVIGGFARLLAEKLLLLDQESGAQTEEGSPEKDS